MAESSFNPLNAKLNPICPLLALLGAHHILHVSRIRVKILLGRGTLYTLNEEKSEMGVVSKSDRK
jgi:hypothetical protein